jgi:hypothetical protein
VDGALSCETNWNFPAGVKLIQFSQLVEAVTLGGSGLISTEISRVLLASIGPRIPDTSVFSSAPQKHINIAHTNSFFVVGSSFHYTLFRLRLYKATMVSTMEDSFIPSKAYNCLPYILDVAEVPQKNRKDIDDLLSLFRKHKLAQGIRVKLVHKHFDAESDEVMVLRDIAVPCQGPVSIMGPMVPQKAPPLRGLNYMVDGDGQLRSYEYSISAGPDMRPYETFFKEFCSLIVERDLQRKLGLRVGLETDRIGWTEFEVAEKRGTVMIAQDVALPKFDFEVTVVTEWEADRIAEGTCIGHCGSHCYGHKHVCKSHPKGEPPLTDDWYLAGRRLQIGSPLQVIVSTAVGKL